MGRRHFNPMEHPEDQDPGGDGEDDRLGADFQVVRVLDERAKAIKVRLSNGDDKWLPKAVIHDDSEVFELGHKGKLIVFEWWAEKEGWL